MSSSHYSSLSNPNPNRFAIRAVFSVPTRTHAAYQIRAFGHNTKKYLFRMDVGDMPPLYEHEGAISEKTYAPGGFAA